MRINVPMSDCQSGGCGWGIKLKLQLPNNYNTKSSGTVIHSCLIFFRVVDLKEMTMRVWVDCSRKLFCRVEYIFKSRGIRWRCRVKRGGR